MTNNIVPDEAVFAAAKAITGPLRDPTEWELEQFKRSLTAALPFLTGVKVKALKWSNSDELRNDEWLCSTETLPSYSIMRWWLDDVREEVGHFEVEAIGGDQFGTLDEAKAAAQADYDARILSAIEVSASDCECTKIQQDETCPVGYPSLLCEICDGKGVVPYVKLDGPELWEIVFGIANEVAHEITDEQYTKIAEAINSVFIDPVTTVSTPSPRAQALEEAHSDLINRLNDDITQLERMAKQTKFAGSETGVRVKSPSILLADLRDASAAIRALSSQPVADGSAAACDVLAERRRQVEAEGWTPEHDDNHANGEIARAAACYITAKERTHLPTVPLKWPWSDAWWKPDGYRRNLVKAGALILAEIDRLDRLPASLGASE